MKNYLQELNDFLSDKLVFDDEKVDFQLEIPPKADMGDYALPCFPLAKVLHKAPQMIAGDIAASLAQEDDLPTFIERIEAMGPYVNFFVDPVQYTKEALEEIFQEKDAYGSSEEGAGKTVLVEYSSPNIAKPFHVGHAFSTLLGASISRIYEHLGYDVKRLNHLGDYGTQFGKLIVAYRLWGDPEKLEEDPIPELLRVYVKFHHEAKEHPELEDQAREAFNKLEHGEEAELALWKKFRDLSIEAFNEVYERLGLDFDSWNGESFYSDKMQAVVDMLDSKGLLEESEGAKVVRFDDPNIPPCIVVKSDGSSIYATRDLAAAIYRWDHYHFDQNIYVVGNPQTLHFKQVFGVLKKAGYDFADRCKHVGFGFVKFPDRILSTREGDVVHLTDLLDQSVARARQIIVDNAETRGEDFAEDELNTIAEKVGLGAVVYLFQKNGRDRDIIFDWDEVLDFEGDTGPYLQYTYARCFSILRKAKEQGITIPNVDDMEFIYLNEDDVLPLIKVLAGFPAAVREAAKTFEPFMISRQIHEIAREFNRYYNQVPILKDDNERRRQEKLALCQAVIIVMGVGLDLLGIERTERI